MVSISNPEEQATEDESARIDRQQLQVCKRQKNSQSHGINDEDNQLLMSISQYTLSTSIACELARTVVGSSAGFPNPSDPM